MNLGNLSDNIPVIITIVVLILLQFFLRRKRSPETSNAGIVRGILSEVRLNLKMVDIFDYSKPGRKFMTTSWHLYQNKLEFLDQKLQTMISDTFRMCEDYNEQIASAKKYKSTSYLASLNMTKLGGLLGKTQEGLEEWLASRPETAEAATKAPGVFGDFTGGR
jgi:hypothetical protein